MSDRVNQSEAPVIIVSGLPRSGTSLMMQLIETAGIPLLTDQTRPADENNPRGYFEYEPVKTLMRDNTWVAAAAGKAVKVIVQLIPHLPANTPLDVLLMDRAMVEIVHSQSTMLKRMKQSLSVDCHKLQKVFQEQRQAVVAYLNKRPKTRLREVNYAQLVAKNPNEFEKITAFLGLATTLQTKMMNCIDENLYRVQLPESNQADQI